MPVQSAEDMNDFLPYGRHVVDEDDIAAVANVLRGDWLTTGPAVEAFERKLADRVGARYAVACSSGTAGLHLAMLAAGIGQGDVAVVPTLTFLATANAARYVGAEVCFADVDQESGLITPAKLEKALAQSSTPPRVVLPVHLAGRVADMAALNEIATRHDLIMIEDACHALGSTMDVDCKRIVVGACSHSTMAVFSFHPVKTIAMGEGGAVTTNDPLLYEKLVRFRSHGMVRDPSRFRATELAFAPDGSANPWYYEMPEIGFNYRASDINCALASSQMNKLDSFIAARRSLADRYDELLAHLAPTVLPPARTKLNDPAWHLYAPRIDFHALSISRADVMHRLKAQGVGTQVHYVPVHLQSYYQDRYGEQQLDGAMDYYRRTLSLPLFPTMSDGDVKRVVDALRSVLK